MIDRMDKEIDKAGKHTYYTKIWRIDGEIDTLSWKSLISSYFRDNTLIGEYLGGVDVNPYAHNIPENKEVFGDHCGKKYDYVPYSMNSGEGLRVCICYRQSEAALEEERLTHSIVSNDYLTDGEKNTFILDSRVVDIIKLLRKSGAITQELEEFAIVKFQDGYVNFPTIMHSKYELENNIRLTQNIVLQAVNIWHEGGLDIVLAYSLGFQIEDRIVLISIMGHIDDIWEWSKSPISRIPSTKVDLDDWAEKIVDYLDNNYPAANDCPAMSNTLKNSGLLAILRQQPSNLDYEFIRDEAGLKYRLKTSSLDSQALTLIQSNLLSLSGGFNIHKLTCSNCGSEYIQCSCNSLIDKTVSKRIDKCTPLPPHWTDRHRI